MATLEVNDNNNFYGKIEKNTNEKSGIFSNIFKKKDNVDHQW